MAIRRRTRRCGVAALPGRRHTARVLRTTLIYGPLLALLAVGLQWLEFQYVVRTHATETYIALIALTFLGLGIWAGARLFHRAPAAREFTPNTQALESLQISDREFEVLRLLASGQSNKEIAR